VAQAPRHQFSLWNKVDVTDALGAGIGLFHQSKSFATISNAAVIPAHTRVDLGLYVKLGERIDLQLNVENLFNTAYFPFAHNDHNFSTGAPLNARATIGVKF
jgi:catecholate siderophore receptor